MITAPPGPIVGSTHVPASDTRQEPDNAASRATDGFVRASSPSAAQAVQAARLPVLFGFEAPRNASAARHFRARHRKAGVEHTATKRKTPNALSPAEIAGFLASGDLQEARLGLQQWVRSTCRAPGRSPRERDAIVSAANAITAAFVQRTDAGAHAEPALARRKTAICITADALNTWDASLHVHDAEVVAPAPPFVRAFRSGDVVLGMADAREKLLCMLPAMLRETAYADATNSAWILSGDRLSRSAAKYVTVHRPDFVGAFMRAEITGNRALAEKMWQWIRTEPKLRAKIEERLKLLNVNSGTRSQEETREHFYRLSRLLCKARIQYTLAMGGRVHFELGAGFDYHAAASKTRPGSARTLPEESSGHFTSSELRTVCAALADRPDRAGQIFFYKDSFPVPPPPDLSAHYVPRAK